MAAPAMKWRNNANESRPPWAPFIDYAQGAKDEAIVKAEYIAANCFGPGSKPGAILITDAEANSTMDSAGLICTFTQLKAKAQLLGLGLPGLTHGGMLQGGVNFPELFRPDTEILRAWAYRYAPEFISETIEQPSMDWRWW
jgi:hypothetical protein